MASCSICFEDVDEHRVTPCCQSLVCPACGEFDKCLRSQMNSPPECRALDCHRPVTDPAGWELILTPEDFQRLKEQIARTTGSVATEAPNLASDDVRKSAAWAHGAYAHGCGEIFVVSDGCDVVTCPGCRRVVNAVGGHPAEHTYLLKAFFGDARGCDPDTNATYVDTLRNRHSVAWNALFLDELIATVRAGDPSGWLDAMDTETWGTFVAFLRDRVRPRTGPALDGTSLRTLYASVCADQSLAADATVLYELFSNHAPQMLEHMRRMKILNRLADRRLRDILTKNLANEDPAWWN